MGKELFNWNDYNQDVIVPNQSNDRYPSRREMQYQERLIKDKYKKREKSLESKHTKTNN